jgi:polyhydroxyalkanoate synthesis regulator protein
MKGDISVRPEPTRDAKLQKIADHHKTTVNQLLGMFGQEFSRIHPRHLYQCLAAIGERDEQLRDQERRRTGKHQNAP